MKRKIRKVKSICVPEEVKISDQAFRSDMGALGTLAVGEWIWRQAPVFGLRQYQVRAILRDGEVKLYDPEFDIEFYTYERSILKRLVGRGKGEFEGFAGSIQA